jgi:hypothetical protein
MSISIGFGLSVNFRLSGNILPPYVLGKKPSWNSNKTKERDKLYDKEILQNAPNDHFKLRGQLQQPHAGAWDCLFFLFIVNRTLITPTFADKISKPFMD